ncbi:hypothetical protein B296_00009696 [Ensete ventricosum]|uniref:Uncharacterized protein n=1 Tax=Ensete ventricosum TaxID=4639 RepID=A0A426YAM6_ENSVE|nr:hypothetical protein B296_00009696 [Ensete ventricosum]
MKRTVAGLAPCPESSQPPSMPTIEVSATYGADPTGMVPLEGATTGTDPAIMVLLVGATSRANHVEMGPAMHATHGADHLAKKMKVLANKETSHKDATAPKPPPEAPRGEGSNRRRNKVMSRHQSMRDISGLGLAPRTSLF